ncbi:unnamed protein product [Spodoptera exigua]|nr:unnamed protein product [Spodoptera exigua]
MNKIYNNNFNILPMTRCDYDAVFYRVFCITLLAIAFTFTVILTNVFIDIDGLLANRHDTHINDDVVHDEFTPEGNDINEENNYGENDDSYRTKRSIAETQSFLFHIKNPKVKNILANKLSALLEELDTGEAADDKIKEKKPKEVQRTSESPPYTPKLIEDDKKKKDDELLHLTMHNILLQGIIGHMDLNEVYKRVYSLMSNFNDLQNKRDGLKQKPDEKSNVDTESRILPKPIEAKLFDEMMNCKELQEQIVESATVKEEIKKPVKAKPNVMIKTIIDISSLTNEKAKENDTKSTNEHTDFLMRLQQPLNSDNSGENLNTNYFDEIGKMNFFIKDIDGSGFSVGFNQYVDEPPDPDTMKLFTGLENVIQTYHQTYDPLPEASQDSFTREAKVKPENPPNTSNDDSIGTPKPYLLKLPLKMENSHENEPKEEVRTTTGMLRTVMPTTITTVLPTTTTTTTTTPNPIIQQQTFSENIKKHIISTIERNGNLTDQILRKIDKNTEILQIFLKRLTEKIQVTTSKPVTRFIGFQIYKDWEEMGHGKVLGLRSANQLTDYLMLIISILWLGSFCCSGFTLTKVKPSNLVYKVIEDKVRNSLTISSPRLKNSTLREIIYYHIIERPFWKSEDKSDEVEQSDDEKPDSDIEAINQEDKLKRSTNEVSEDSDVIPEDTAKEETEDEVKDASGDALENTPRAEPENGQEDLQGDTEIDKQKDTEEVPEVAHIDGLEDKVNEVSENTARNPVENGQTDLQEDMQGDNIKDEQKDTAEVPRDALEGGNQDALEDIHNSVSEELLTEQKRRKRGVVEADELSKDLRLKREIQYGQRILPRVPPAKLTNYVKNILSLNAQKPFTIKPPKAESNNALKSEISSFKDAAHRLPTEVPRTVRPKTYGMVLRGNDAIVWNDLNGRIAYHVGPGSFEDIGELNSESKESDSKESNEKNSFSSSQESFENVTHSQVVVNGLEDNKNSIEEIEENSNEIASNSSEESSGEEDSDSAESNASSDKSEDSEVKSKEEKDKSDNKVATNDIVNKIDKIIDDVHDIIVKGNTSIVIDKDKVHVSSDINKKEEQKLKPGLDIKIKDSDKSNIINVLEGLFTKIVKNKIVINNNVPLSEESDKIVPEKEVVGTEKQKNQVDGTVVKITPEKDEDSKENENPDIDTEKPSKKENDENITTEKSYNTESENNTQKPESQKEEDDDFEKDSSKDNERIHKTKDTKENDAIDKENNQETTSENKDQHSEIDEKQKEPLEDVKKITEDVKDEKEESQDVTEAPDNKLKEPVQEKEKDDKDAELDKVMDLINNETFWDFMGDLGKKYIASLSERTKKFIKEEVTEQINKYFEEHKSELNPEKEVLRENKPEISPQKDEIDVKNSDDSDKTVANPSSVEDNTEKPVEQENTEGDTKKTKVDKISDEKIEENKPTEDKSRKIPSVNVKANNIYGNSVGNDKVTNVYIFYGSKNLGDVIKNVKGLVDGTDSTNVFAFGPEKEKHISHKKDKLNKDSHNEEGANKSSKEQDIKDLVKEKVDSKEIKEQTELNVVKDSEETPNLKVDLIAEKDTATEVEEEKDNASAKQKEPESSDQSDKESSSNKNDDLDKEVKKPLKEDPVLSSEKKKSTETEITAEEDESSDKKDASSEKDATKKTDKSTENKGESAKKKNDSAAKDKSVENDADLEKKDESTEKKDKPAETKDDSAEITESNKKNEKSAGKKSESAGKKDKSEKKDKAEETKNESPEKSEEKDISTEKDVTGDSKDVSLEKNESSDKKEDEVSENEKSVEKDEPIEKKDKSAEADASGEKKDEKNEKIEDSTEKKDEPAGTDEGAKEKGELSEKKDETAEKEDKSPEKDVSSEKKDKTTEKKDDSTEKKDESAGKKDESNEKKDESADKKDESDEKEKSVEKEESDKVDNTEDTEKKTPEKYNVS